MATLLEELRQKAAQFYEQEKFKVIIELLSDSILEKHKDAELYAWRARAHYRIDENDKTIIYAQKAIDIDENYWMSYLARGTALLYENEHNKVLADFNKAIDLKPDDANTYVNRALLWSEQGEYDKAIKDLNKAIDLKPDFAAAYYNRGVIWDDKSEFDKATADYNKTIELKPDFAKAIFSLGMVLEIKGQLNEALEKFESAKALNHRTGDAEFMINEIKERLTVKLEDDIDNDIEKIKSIVSVIRQKSLSGKEVKQVVHYTKLNVADKVTNDCHSCLHYSNVIYMNDPEEGQKFIEYLDDLEIKKWFEKASYKNESTIFLGSFLPVQTNDDDDGSAEDQLLLWRTYGKDEKGVDAAGCNFVIGTGFFDTEKTKTATALPKTFKKINEAIEKGARFSDDSRNSLLKVQYIRGSKILYDEDKVLASLIIYLKEEIKNLIAKNEKEVDNEESKLYTDSRIFDALQELCHLFKSADYSFEKEVRIIRKESRNSESIEYYKQPDEKAGEKEPKPPRHFYVKSEKRILPYLQKIYLGPKVKDPSHWSLHLDYSLRKAEQIEAQELPVLIDLEDKAKKETLTEPEKAGLVSLRKVFPGSDAIKEKIKPNEIEIIPSKCRFV